jgi:hypothetical protein
MIMKLIPVVLAVGLVGGVGDLASAQGHTHSPAGKFGTVNFETSCNADAQRQIDRAVALLHSFDFQRAIDDFTAAGTADATCGIAQWGVALSLWTNPFAIGIKPEAQVRRGSDATERARTIGAKTERERAYIDAVSQLYRDVEHRTQAQRLLAYRDAMAAVAAKYPQDSEAAIFHALALAFSADPADKTYADQLKAGALLEQLFQKYPDHPGLAHYIIHSYDVPALASHAVNAARRYAEIAPSAPHALHMPSHTFTRVGYWDESIAANLAAVAASKAESAAAEELHASDYETYAYLQTGRDDAVRRIVDSLPEIVSRFDPTKISAGGGGAPVAYYAMAAIPARFALERGAWSDAARLPVRESPYAYADAITYFVRAVGAARAGDAASARVALERLAGLPDSLMKAGESYWADQVEIQRMGAAAWIAYADGLQDEALAQMQKAADREDATEKSAVTPGPIAPAREMLGEMLLAQGRPADALNAFESTLAKEPNRFRTVAGAMQAAQAAGKTNASANYATALLKLAEKADAPGRPELALARKITGRP